MGYKVSARDCICREGLPRAREEMNRCAAEKKEGGKRTTKERGARGKGQGGEEGGEETNLK